MELSQFISAEELAGPVEVRGPGSKHSWRYLVICFKEVQIPNCRGKEETP